jgi:tRNA1Val (adenine37-N6)-methyltransferase
MIQKEMRRMCASLFERGMEAETLDHLIHEDETVEDLQLGGLRLLQKKTGFRFGMDSVLLADFAAVRKEDTVVDFGTGTGILPLLLIGRDKGSRFRAIEIQEEYCEMASRTMALNHLEERVSVICGDAGNADRMMAPCSVDAVICNPPYGIHGAALSSPFPDRATARNQEGDTLSRFFTAAFRILRGKGRFSMVYPAPQMLQAMEQMRRCHLEPKRFQLIYPRENKPANLVLIEGVKDARPTLKPMAPLIIYDNSMHLTNKLKSIYHIEEQNPV